MKENIYGTIDKESYLCIRNAICHYVFKRQQSKLSGQLSGPQLKQILKCINPASFDDREILDNPGLKNMLDWNLLGRKQLVRLMTRDPSIIENLDLKKLDFKVFELGIFLKIYPECIGLFNIDFNNLIGKEIITLLQINPGYIEKINFSSSGLTRLDQLEIIKNFFNNDKIMSLMNFEEFDNIMIKHILTNTGEKYIEKLNLEILSFLDWIDILTQRPKLFQHCDVSQFVQGDCFYLCKLARVLPEVFELIEMNKEKISSNGWEILLINDFEKYSTICDFNKLKIKNWNYIIGKCPNLEKFKVLHYSSESS